MRRLLVSVFLLLGSCGMAAGLSRGAADAQKALSDNQSKFDLFMGTISRSLGQIQAIADIVSKVDWQQLPLLLANLQQMKLDWQAYSAELKAAAPKAFAAADKNGDGKISADEVFTYLKVGGPAGLLALLGVLRKMMQTADAATKKELQAMIDALSASHDETVADLDKVATAANVKL